MSTAEPAFLFVYGTLMTRARSALGADERARLRRRGTSLGPATTVGRLVDLGQYPGLVGPAGPRDVVHGELFRLDHPDEVLAWLDDYEGVSPEPAPDDEYERIRAPVRLPSGDEVTAWVYRYRGDISLARFVGGGRWVG